MDSYNIHEAKTHFSKLVDAVMHGEEVVISKAGKPVAILSPFAKRKPTIRFGVMKGKIKKVAKDFDAPLPEDILAEFELDQIIKNLS